MLGSSNRGAHRPWPPKRSGVGERGESSHSLPAEVRDPGRALARAAGISLGLTLLLLPFWWHTVLLRGTRPDLYFTYQSVLVYAGDVLLGASLLVWGADRLIHPRALAPLPRDLGLWGLALAGWCALSLVWSVQPALSLAFALRYVVGVTAVLCLTNLRFASRQMVWWLTAGLLLQSGIAAAEVALQSAAFLRPLALTWPGDLAVNQSGTSVVESLIGGRWLRAYGTLPHPNVLGGFLLVYLAGPALGYLRTGGRVWLLPWLVGVAALWLTLSRGAWVAALAGGAALLALLPGAYRGRALVLGVCALPVALALSLALPNVVLTRLTPEAASAAPLERLSLAERERFGQAGRQLWDRHRWLGVGAGAYMVAAADLTDLQAPLEPPHSVPLLAGAELGVIGVALGAGLAIAIGRRLWAERGKGTPAAAVFGAALIALAASAAFDHFWWTMPPAQTLSWLALGMWLQARRS